ncbi:30S ribosomal protein S3 [Spiroplasma endosymbiont of Nephrotoma flavescens]|uniref:30S ribosomal protein S3 n=1 Tax=Spiroplasma endosymbiont of Nephrotoma flavescens TaxID=3066302 RepID=UPI00313C2D0B
MGQKASPHGLRLGINKDWDSRWYAKDKNFANWLHSDIKIRKVILKKWKNAAIAKVEIERTKENITLFIHSSRPGVVLGQEGSNIENIIKAIRRAIGLTTNSKLDIKINVVDIKVSDLNAQLVAENMAQQIVNRASFRTIQKLAIRKAMKAGAKGIKTLVSGRLGGVDMARSEGYAEGSVPLATLRSDIDYAKASALTTYGLIGIKVWIYKGEILSEKKNSVKEAK